MNYLHYDLNLSPSDAVEVKLDKQANVRLLDESNFNLYKQGKNHRYFGGKATQTPVIMAPPNPGRWHLVVDLGGYAGSVRAEVRTVKGVA